MHQGNHQTDIKSLNEYQPLWVDKETLYMVYFFTCKRGLDNAFTEVGYSSNWRFSLLRMIRSYVENMKNV